MEVIKRKNGDRYREKIYDNGKQIQSPLFKQKTLARQWKREALLERDRLKAVGVKIDSTLKFGDFLQIWLESKNDKARRTIDAYKNAIDNYFLPFFGKYKLRDLTLHLGESFKYELLKKNKLSHIRVNTILRILKSILNYSVIRGNLLRSPFLSLEFVRVQERSLQYWHRHEVQTFLEANKDDEFFYVFLVTLSLGLRKSEVCGLMFDCVDFEGKFIIIRRIRDRYGLKNETKSKKIRKIPLNDHMIEVFQLLFAKKRPHNFVFTNRNGEPIDYHHIGDRYFQRAIKRANVRKIRFHDLRTTFASNFCRNNGNIFVLSKILGHSKVDITQKCYAELDGQHIQDAMSCISFQFENSEINKGHLALLS